MEWWILLGIVIVGIFIIDWCAVAASRTKDDDENDFEDQRKAIEEWLAKQNKHRTDIK